MEKIRKKYPLPPLHTLLAILQRLHMIKNIQIHPDKPK